MRGWVISTVGLDFYDLADEFFAMMNAHEVLAEELFGNLQGRAKVKTPGELLH
jgi:hypothetical protein